MKKSLILCAFSIFCTIMNAQDKIVTIKNDTIECHILSITAEYISYEQKTTDGQTAFIPLQQVATWFHSSQPSTRPKHPWLFNINVGGSQMPWLSHEKGDELSIFNEKTSGYHISASWHYLITSFYGLGMQYSFFYSSGNNKYMPADDPDYPNYIVLFEKEKQYVNYLGPSVIFQQFLDKNKKIQFFETLSGGVLFYRIESQISTTILTSSGYSAYSYNTLNTSRNFGATIGFSAEYCISPSFSIGVGGNFLFGILRSMSTYRRSF